MKKLGFKFLRLCMFILVLYLAAVIALYLRQRDLVFQPYAGIPPASEVLENAEDVTFTTSDGVTIQAFWQAPKAGDNRPVALYLHGNAGHLGRRSDLLRGVADETAGMLAISWRGYGNSGGEPTEDGLYDDARAGLAFLMRQNIPLNRIILVGESLGTGVAVQIATEFAAGGVLLIAPYTRLPDIGARQYPLVPVQLLMKDKFASIDKLPHVDEPLVVIHSTSDTLVPTIMGEEMIEAANEPKQLILLDNRGHVNFTQADIAAAVQALKSIMPTATELPAQ